MFHECAFTAAVRRSIMRPANRQRAGRAMKLASAIDTQSKEFRANAAAMRALVQQLEERRGQAALGGPARSRDRHTSRGKLLPRERVLRLIDAGHAVPRALAARRQRHVRGRDPRRRHHHRHRPHRGARVRDRVQRRHHQGRHLLSGDREEAPARAGDRAREPAALHLSGRFRRREPAAMAGGVSRTASTSAASSTTRRRSPRSAFRRSPA